MQIWDTAGQERFRAVTKSYWRGAAGALIVYDITSDDAHNQVKDWLRQLRDCCGSDLTVCLVGNKVDLEEYRAACTAEIAEFAGQEGCLFRQVSAICGQVDGVFEAVASNVLFKIEAGIIDPGQSGNGVTLREQSIVYSGERNKKGCVCFCFLESSQRRTIALAQRQWQTTIQKRENNFNTQTR